MNVFEGREKDIQSWTVKADEMPLLWVTKEIKFFLGTLCAIDIITSSREKNLLCSH